MGSLERSKKGIQLWKKAAIHFSLCFVMGFFTGFAPTSTASLFSRQANPYRATKNLGISADPAPLLRKPLQNSTLNETAATDQTNNGTSSSAAPVEAEDDDVTEQLRPRSLLIMITTTRPGDGMRGPMLRRLAHTLRLAPAPLLWIVVEPHGDAPRTADVLRMTGIMYRHLTYKENFTDAAAEADHQRNVALNHIEYHRLDGVVHFADASNIYDLEFFDRIREIDVFGAWPVVMVSANRRRVLVEGPVCSGAKVVGWQLKDLNNGTKETGSPMEIQETGDGAAAAETTARINISGFAFNSSILWDPERWGRPSSVLDTSQDSVKFVQEVVLEDEAKLKAIPSDCSKLMLWHLHVPMALTPSK